MALEPTKPIQSSYSGPTLDQLKSISIFTVATALGLDLQKRSDTSAFPVFIDGIETSLFIYPETNSFHRFSQKGIRPSGSVIDLVMHIKECDIRAAISFLTELL